MIAARAKQLPNLIQPHIGDHITDGSQILRMSELIQQAPALAPEQHRSDRGAAARRPPGARSVDVEAVHGARADGAARVGA